MSSSNARCQRPNRPAITVAFASGIMFWAGCAAAYSQSQALNAGICSASAIGLSIAGLAMLGFGLFMKFPTIGVALACACLGVALGCANASFMHTQADEINRLALNHIEAVVESDSRQNGNEESVQVEAKLENGKTARIHVDIYSTEPLMNGERVVLSGALAPSDISSDDYLWQHASIARYRATTCEKLEGAGSLGVLGDVRRAALKAIGNDDEAHMLLQALICGWRHDIVTAPTYARFQSCGLAHLVAVSGAHLVIVMSLFATILRALNVSRRVSVLVLVIVMAVYLMLSGIPVSAVRAALMSSVGLLAIFGRRRPSAQNALGIGIFVIVLVSPNASVSTSFALSALSTAGIVLFAPLISSIIKRLSRGRMAFVTDALSMTAAAGVLSQPYACAVFGILPVISPLANIVCAPLFPLVCSLGMTSAFASVISVPGADVLLSMASEVAFALEWTVSALSQIPYGAIPLSISVEAALALSLMGGAIFYLAWNRINMRCLAACLACTIAVFLVASFASGYQDALIMFDVGQGDSFLFRSKGRTLLVDTGNQDTRLLKQLAACSVSRLDSVLLTHADDDHVGSLDALEKAVDVGRVIVFSGIEQSVSAKNMKLMQQAHDTAHEVTTVGYGDSFDIGSFRATVVWPRALEDNGGNADSICLFVEYDGNEDGQVDFRILMTGDAESEQLANVIRSGVVGDVDVLKVGHHGSAGALNDDLVHTLKPEIALIGVGEGNKYGHPSGETLETLSRAGCRVYRSDRDGLVSCLFDSGSIHVGLQ